MTNYRNLRELMNREAIIEAESFCTRAENREKILLTAPFYLRELFFLPSDESALRYKAENQLSNINKETRLIILESFPNPFFFGTKNKEEIQVSEILKGSYLSVLYWLRKEENKLDKFLKRIEPLYSSSSELQIFENLESFFKYAQPFKKRALFSQYRYKLIEGLYEKGIEIAFPSNKNNKLSIAYICLLCEAAECCNDINILLYSKLSKNSYYNKQKDKINSLANIGEDIPEEEKCITDIEENPLIFWDNMGEN